MNKIQKYILHIALVGAFFGACEARASVVIAGTRIIFSGQDREVTVKLNNNGVSPALVQTWLDEGDSNSSPDDIDVPFSVTPALFRLDPSKGQALRIINTSASHSKDKETLYWLNVLEVPPRAQGGSDGGNRLQLAFRTRIKVIYRPEKLAGKVEGSPGKVVWAIEPMEKNSGYALKATNPTSYFVNLGKVTLTANGKVFDAGAGFVGPGEVAIFPISGLTKSPDMPLVVDYISINDFGGGVKGSSPVSSVGR